MSLQCCTLFLLCLKIIYPVYRGGSMLKHWPQCPSPAVSITTNSLVRPSPPRLQCLDSTSTAIVQGPVTCHRTANPLMGPKYNDFNNENSTQVRGIVLSGIMIMTKHDQLVRVSINIVMIGCMSL